MSKSINNPKKENQPGKLYFEIPENYFTSTDAERAAFIGSIYDEALKHFQISEKGKKGRGK